MNKPLSIALVALLLCGGVVAFSGCATTRHTDGTTEIQMDIDAVRALLEIARTQLATLQEQQGSIPDQEYAERVAYIFDKIETYREMLIQLLEAAGYGDGVDQTDAPV